MSPNKKVTKEIGIGGGANCFAKCALPLRTPSRDRNLQILHLIEGKNVPIFALPNLRFSKCLQVSGGRIAKGGAIGSERPLCSASFAYFLPKQEIGPPEAKQNLV